jgi:hypothetical protein
VTSTYEYGTFGAYDDDSKLDDGGNYLYSLRQFVLMRRCRRPFATWDEVIKYGDDWFRQREHLDPNELKSFAGWSGDPEVWAF